MKSTRTLAVVSALFVPFLIVVVGNGCSSCKKDETEPVPSAAPPPPPTATPVTTVAPEEDAGLDAGPDGDASDGKVVGGGDPTGVRKCCQALRQNAKSALPEQQGALLAAAGACDGLVNSPQGRQGLATVRGILRGASVPAECK
jgi:hypothetical protein